MAPGTAGDRGRSKGAARPEGQVGSGGKEGSVPVGIGVDGSRLTSSSHSPPLSEQLHYLLDDDILWKKPIHQVNLVGAERTLFNDCLGLLRPTWDFWIMRVLLKQLL